MATPAKRPRPSYDIDDLSVHPNIIKKLKEGKLFTFKRILHLSFIELQKIAHLSLLEAQNTVSAVSRAIIEKEPITAYELCQKETLPCELQLKWNNISNKAFSSFYTGTVTEICGESGSGKTQLCLYLSILAQLQTSDGGLNTKVIYIHTEGEFPIKRFMQIASAFKEEHKEIQNINLSNNLVLKQVHNLNALIHVLQYGLPDLMKKLNTKLLIIDSVASVLRADFESANLRNSTIQNFGSIIRNLANIYGIAVICVNQVSGHTKIDDSTGTTCLTDIPSLGLLWSNVLTTRLKISRKLSSTEQTLRVLEYIFSAYHPRMTIDFVISEKGVEFL